MRVEEAGNDGAASEIDRPNRCRGWARLSDRDNASILNRDHRAHDAASIDELAVNESEIC
jgi:hypothetical protein